jgi:hypothetical protein
MQTQKSFDKAKALPKPFLMLIFLAVETPLNLNEHSWIRTSDLYDVNVAL